MKILFFGSGKIALPSLEALINRDFNVVGVITAPDSKKGRHLLISHTPVMDYALKKKLKIYQPTEIATEETLENIKEFNADLFVVFAYGKILPKELLVIPKKYPLNIHASLLPKYRGAAPINWALINGEGKTGITVIKMNEGIDEGDVLIQKELIIENCDNALTLEEKLGHLGAELICEAVERIHNNNALFKPQNPQEASFAPKLKKTDGRINWNMGAQQIRNQVRGCMPWPGAVTFLKNKMIKIWACEAVETISREHASPGMIISLKKDGLIVTTSDHSLLIKELQLANTKRLNAWQFIQGHRLKEGEMFT